MSTRWSGSALAQSGRLRAANTAAGRFAVASVIETSIRGTTARLARLMCVRTLRWELRDFPERRTFVEL